MLSEAAEDCLQQIFRFEERGERATTSLLAQTLEVRDSTMTVMIQKLAESGLLNYKLRKEMSLTEHGRLEAAKLIRRHRIVETYLWLHLGYSWADVHAEADSIEHSVSERFVRQTSEVMGNPESDVHGDPIPDIKGFVKTGEMLSLTKTQVGRKYRLSRVMDQKPPVLTYLDTLGFYIGMRLTVVQKPIEDSFVRFTVMGQDQILGKELAEFIFVEELAD